MTGPDESLRPRFGTNVFVSEGATIIGNVIVGDDVFIAPNAVIRSDEPGSTVIIGEGCNIQDNAVIHCLKDCQATIGPGTSVGHGAIVHGPCEIGSNCFIGFGSIVFRTRLGDGSVVLHRVLLEDTIIGPGKKVPSGTVMVGPLTDRLDPVDDALMRFVQGVRDVNRQLTRAYLDSISNKTTLMINNL